MDDEDLGRRDLVEIGQRATAWPERFMKVVGCSSQSFAGARRLAEELALRGERAFSLSARWSTNQKPTLCRVASYSGPGLPRPTIRRGVIHGGKMKKPPAA
jgi:hypothetical protein